MNIEAAKAVADAIRTSLGPRGMDKMVGAGRELGGSWGRVYCRVGRCKALHQSWSRAAAAGQAAGT